MKYILLFILIIALTATACKRKYIRGDLKNRREILQGANWKLVEMTGNGGITALPRCQDDNYYVYNPNSVGRYEEGAVNCLDSTGTGNAPTYTPFTWQMTGDLRYLYLINYAGDPDRRIDWEILDMSFERLKVRQKLIVDGIDVRLDMTFMAIPK